MPVIPAHRRWRKENQTKVILGYIRSSRPTEKKQNRTPKLSVHVIWTVVVECLMELDAGFCYSELFISAEGVDTSLNRFKELSLLCKKCVVTSVRPLEGEKSSVIDQGRGSERMTEKKHVLSRCRDQLFSVSRATHTGDVSENSDISLWSENSTFSWYGMHGIMLTERFIQPR